MAGSPSKRHIDSLDGLRGAAALVVVVSHFANYATRDGGASGLATDVSLSNIQAAAIASLGAGAGQIGVMLFFCLSSFLMFHLYFDREPNETQLRNFFAARVIRIFPLYYASLLLTFLVNEWTPITYIEMGDTSYIGHLFFLEGASVYWTIAPELLFYGAFAVAWCVCRGDPRGLAVTLLVALVFANAVPVVWHSYALEFFLLGFFVYLFHRSGFEIGFDRVPGWLLLPGLGFLVYLQAPLVQEMVFGEKPPLHGWQSEVMLLVVFIVFAVALESRAAGALLGSRLGRFLGAISFSLYLNHLLVLGLLDHLGLIRPNLVSLSFALVASVLFSALVYRLVEAPSRRTLRARFMGRREGRQVAAVSVAR